MPSTIYKGHKAEKIFFKPLGGFEHLIMYTFMALIKLYYYIQYPIFYTSLRRCTLTKSKRKIVRYNPCKDDNILKALSVLLYLSQSVCQHSKLFYIFLSDKYCITYYNIFVPFLK